MVQREKQRQSIDQLGGGFKKEQITPTWVFPKIVVPQNGKSLLKWMIWGYGVPPFTETPTWGNWSNLPIFSDGLVDTTNFPRRSVAREAPAEKRDVSVTVRKAPAD